MKTSHCLVDDSRSSSLYSSIAASMPERAPDREDVE